MFRAEEIRKFLTMALECSVYVEPTAPGLTTAEILEVGRRVGYHDGELIDMVREAPQHKLARILHGNPRLQPSPESQPMWSIFSFRQEPDYRSIPAFDFVRGELRDLARKNGVRAAHVTRDVLVERGVLAGLHRREVEAAVTILVLTEAIAENAAVLSAIQGKHEYVLMREQAQRDDGSPHRREKLAAIYAAVLDVVERRVDGRAQHVEPLDAFAEQLEALGYGPFRMWWKQTVSEFRLLDAGPTPVRQPLLPLLLLRVL